MVKQFIKYSHYRYEKLDNMTEKGDHDLYNILHIRYVRSYVHMYNNFVSFAMLMSV